MIDKRTLMQGMARLAQSVGMKPTGDAWAGRLKLYHEVLADLTDQQFTQAVEAALRTWEGFPPPATLRRLAGKGRDALQLDGVRMFQRLLDTCHVYLPEVGSFYDGRKVAEILGPDAAAAFEAAGGSDAVTGMLERNRPFVEKRFIEAFVARREPQPPALPAGEDQQQIGKGQARQLVGKLHALQGGKARLHE